MINDSQLIMMILKEPHMNKEKQGGRGNRDESEKNLPSYNKISPWLMILLSSITGIPNTFDLGNITDRVLKLHATVFSWSKKNGHWLKTKTPTDIHYIWMRYVLSRMRITTTVLIPDSKATPAKILSKHYLSMTSSSTLAYKNIR